MTLPAGFSELEGFVDLWARDTTGGAALRQEFVRHGGDPGIL